MKWTAARWEVRGGFLCWGGEGTRGSGAQGDGLRGVLRGAQGLKPGQGQKEGTGSIRGETLMSFLRSTRLKSCFGEHDFSSFLAPPGLKILRSAPDCSRNPSPCAPLPRWRSLAEGKERGIPVFYCNFYAKKIRGIRQEMTGFEIWDFMGIKRAGGLFFCVVEGRGECVLGFLREGLGPSFLGFVGDFVEYDRKILWRQVP